MIDRTANIIQRTPQIQAQVYPVYHFKSADGQPILTIWPDGRAEVGPGAADLDEASRTFWAHLADLNPWQAENARLRAQLAALTQAAP